MISSDLLGSNDLTAGVVLEGNYIRFDICSGDNINIRGELAELTVKCEGFIFGDRQSLYNQGFRSINRNVG
jgi:hypothetical protein